MAGRGSDGCGVGARHRFAELREVAFEECPTGITLLGAKRARPRPGPRFFTIPRSLPASVRFKVRRRRLMADGGSSVGCVHDQTQSQITIQRRGSSILY